MDYELIFYELIQAEQEMEAGTRHFYRGDVLLTHYDELILALLAGELVVKDEDIDE